MLDAGRRILAERGFRALTLEAVALEAGASKTTVVEHFRNRAGFLAILLDSLMQDASVQIEMALRDHQDGGAEVGEYVGHLVELLTDVEAGRAFHEIAANALADEAVRRRLAHLFAWYREIGVHRLSLCRGSDSIAPDEMQGLAALLDAVEDGLALQRSMDPDNFDSRPALKLFGRLIELYFADQAKANEGSLHPPAPDG
jgi:AcrR family transcriptional regulator